MPPAHAGLCRAHSKPVCLTALAWCRGSCCGGAPGCAWACLRASLWRSCRTLPVAGQTTLGPCAIGPCLVPTRCGLGQ